MSMSLSHNLDVILYRGRRAIIGNDEYPQVWYPYFQLCPFGAQEAYPFRCRTVPLSSFLLLWGALSEIHQASTS